jgi:hypothetical protein
MGDTSATGLECRDVLRRAGVSLLLVVPGDEVVVQVPGLAWVISSSIHNSLTPLIMR